MMKTFIYCILITTLFSFSPVKVEHGRASIFKAIYENQKRYFDDSLSGDNYNYKHIIDFEYTKAGNNNMIFWK
jgi:hypothetical protein